MFIYAHWVQGSFFGEAGLFKTMNRTATVTSSGESSILRIDRESFVSYLKSNPASGSNTNADYSQSFKKLRTVNQELAFERKLDIGQDDIDALINSLL